MLTRPTGVIRARTAECGQPLNLDLLIDNKAAAPLLAWRLARDRNGVLGSWAESSSRKRTNARRGHRVVSTKSVLVGRNIGADDDDGGRSTGATGIHVSAISGVGRHANTSGGSGSRRGAIGRGELVVASVG